MRSITTRILRSMRTRTVQVLLVFAITLVTVGATDTSARFESVGHKMVCTCGCGQILLECNHVGCPNSEGMIQELRQQLAGGSTDTSIFNSFMAKYGPTVLAAPIRGGFDNAAWIVPIAVFVLAIFGTAWLIRHWRSTAVHAMAGQSGVSAEHSNELRERIRRDTEF